MTTEATQTLDTAFELDEDKELRLRLVRKALKTRFEGKVSYRQGEYIEGIALAKNLGHGDIALHLNRYLAPGDAINIQLDCLTYRGLPIALKGDVLDCRTAEGDHSFMALVHVHRQSRKKLAQ